MQMTLDEKRAWHFANGDWAVADDGIFRPAGGLTDDDGQGLQGYHFAFCKEAAFAGLSAQFRVRHNSFSDVGVILRATDPQHFHVLHFPDCGAASRAMNFWVALSKMDGCGVLRMVKVEHVRRVASHPRGQWHDVEMHLAGDRLEVCIDGRGRFEVSDAGLSGTGCIGLMSFNDAQVRGLTVTGEPVADFAWSEGAARKRHWFHPCPDSDTRWQRPKNLVRDGNGDLLLFYQSAIQKEWRAKSDMLLARSTDHGQTWGDPALITQEPGNYYLHHFPNGELKIATFKREETVIHWRTYSDARRNWSEDGATSEYGPKPPEVEYLQPGPQAFLNLRDGSVLMMLYGPSACNREGVSLYAWGSYHCLAYTSRSEDNGKSWSPLVPLGNRRKVADGDLIDANHDLTEVCAVEMENGEIMALIRPIYSPWMWETWSLDSGRSWGSCVRGPFAGYATPNMLRTRSGAILVAHRPCLTVHCGHDSGKTFDQGTLIDSGEWAMGSMIEVEPDLVLYVYWDTFYSLMRAQFLCVTRSGVTPELRGEERREAAVRDIRPRSVKIL